MFNTIRNYLIDWCVSPSDVQIGKLHQQSIPIDVDIVDSHGDTKFIEQTNPTNTLVYTPTGFQPILHTHKTIKYIEYELNLETKSIICADNHLVILSDGQEIRAIDLIPHYHRVQTIDGSQTVQSVVKLEERSVHMYDLELNDNNHVYYTNGILSHNSITSAIFLLWFAMFIPDKTVLIAANKNDNAIEMISRIQYAYEFIPMWLKPGVTDDGWNKHSLKFDNKSRIVSAATSGNSGRGMSISLLFLDEFAFVAPNIQEEFWTSILPTLSTGGACIMSSTPNGAVDKFASIWRAANMENNTDGLIFQPIHVAWDEPPGRTEQFKKDHIIMLGDLKWKQEYECCGGDTLLTLMDSNGNIMTKSMEELYNEFNAV